MRKAAKARPLSEAEKRWQARVDAAKKAVDAAEQTLAATADPAQQTWRFQEFRQRQREHQEAMRAS